MEKINFKEICKSLNNEIKIQEKKLKTLTDIKDIKETKNLIRDLKNIFQK